MRNPVSKNKVNGSWGGPLVSTHAHTCTHTHTTLSHTYIQGGSEGEGREGETDTETERMWFTSLHSVAVGGLVYTIYTRCELHIYFWKSVILQGSVFPWNVENTKKGIETAGSSPVSTGSFQRPERRPASNMFLITQGRQSIWGFNYGASPS